MTNLPDIDGAIGRDVRRREFLIKKDVVPCVIMTRTNLIEGELHKRGAFRIIDELNDANQFIAVTNAKIHQGNSGNVFEADFIILQVDHILWVKPNMPA